MKGHTRAVSATCLDLISSTDRLESQTVERCSPSLTPPAKLLQLWPAPKGEDGKQQPGAGNSVHGIAVDSKGNLYAGDIRGKRAQKLVRKIDRVDS